MKDLKAQVAIVFKRRIVLEKEISEVVYFRIRLKNFNSINKEIFPAVKKYQLMNNLITRSVINFWEMLEVSTLLWLRPKWDQKGHLENHQISWTSKWFKDSLLVFLLGSHKELLNVLPWEINILRDRNKKECRPDVKQKHPECSSVKQEKFLLAM